MKVIILAGGGGSRLFPMSRQAYPKQFLALEDEQSLLAHTVRRYLPLVGAEDIVVVTNARYRYHVENEMAECGAQAAQVVLEPVGRNTAPAISLAVKFCEERLGAAAGEVVLVAAADHMIRPQDAFEACVLQAAEVARTGAVVTFGIPATAPETGYGYIETEQEGRLEGRPLQSAALTAPPEGEPESGGSFVVRSFKEKPDQETAERYVAAGNYYWNSGMFAFTVGTLQQEIAAYEPGIAALLGWAIPAGGHPQSASADSPLREGAKGETSSVRISGQYGGTNSLASLSEGGAERSEAEGVSVGSLAYAVEHFAEMPDISIDYAVAERSQRVRMVPLTCYWNDIGSWDAMYDVLPKDEQGNALRGDILPLDCHDSLIIGRDRLIAGIGLDDLLVVETDDVVLVAKRGESQQVKEVVNRLKKLGRKEAVEHTTMYHAWGTSRVIGHGQGYLMKKVRVLPGKELTLQMHYHRSEHWVFLRGTARVTRGEEQIMLHEGESVFIPQTTKHQLANPGRIPLELIEVQIGTYIGEDDIVRYE